MSDSTTDPGNRSSAEIEREVENTRARLTGTLEELRDRASPGQVFEQVLDYARDSGGADFVRNLGQAVRDNPLPILLIGAGVGWLMFSANRPRSSGSQYRRALPAPAYDGEAGYYGASGPYAETDGSYAEAGGPSMTERASSMAGEAKDRIGEATSGLRDSISGAAARAGDMARQAGDMASSAYHRATDTAQRARGAAGSAADSIGSAAGSVRQGMASAGQGMASAGHEAREQLGYLGDRTSRGFGWMMQEQPLILGAVGLAVGAAIGALLPGTETEDRLMGETRDRLADQARDAAQEGYERVKEATGEHIEHARAAIGEATGEAKERLDHSGVSVSRAGEALGDAAREVRQAVRDAARDMAGEARSTIGGADDRTSGQPKPPEGPGTSDSANRGRPGPV